MLFQRTLPTLLLYALHATGPAASQSTGTDYILLVTDPNYTDLSQCAQTCLQCTAFDCSSVVTESQCTTNKCLCRPSYLGTALNFAYTCVKDRCKDLSDAQAAQDTYKAYCAAKGYTSVLAPEGTTAQSSPTSVASNPLNTLLTRPVSSAQNTALPSLALSIPTQASPNPTGSATNSPPPSTNNNTDNKPLGPAEIVGIVVGVLSLIAACVGLFIQQRNKKSRGDEEARRRDSLLANQRS